jgi:hypothetical protein
MLLPDSAGRREAVRRRISADCGETLQLEVLPKGPSGAGPSGRVIYCQRSAVDGESARATGKMSITEAVADILGEVLAFRVGIQEGAILLRRKFEITVQFTAVKKQVQGARRSKVCTGGEYAGIQSQPVHDSLPLPIFDHVSVASLTPANNVFRLDRSMIPES